MTSVSPCSERRPPWLYAWPLLALLGGCQSTLGPLDWDGGYQRVDSDADATTTQTLLLPRRCTLAEPAEHGATVALPPGCANDLNLQQTVVNPRELVIGTAMGPARAAPVAAAAQERLSDREQANQRRRQLEQEARNALGDSGTTNDL